MKKPDRSELIDEVNNDSRFLYLLSKDDITGDEMIELITYPSEYMDRLNKWYFEQQVKNMVKYYKKYLNIELSFADAVEMVKKVWR